jgi:hypothetical protein
MRQLRFLAFLAVLILPGGVNPAAAATLGSAVVTATQNSGCTTPPATGTLLPTDNQAYVFLYARAMTVTDTGKMEVYGPAGTLLTTLTVGPVTTAGNWCFYRPLDLASAVFNHALGKYTIKGYMNDDAFFTLNFWIQKPGLTMEQKLFDFQAVASLYAKRYAPYEWKKRLFGYDALDLKPWLDKVSATTGDMDYLDLLVQYVAALNDTHSTYRIPTTFSAGLGLSVDIYWDEGHTRPAVLIDNITRSALPATTYPFQLGDELVSIDGVAVTQLMDGFKKYIAAASEDSGLRRAAGYLTARSQSALPLAYEYANTATVEIKRQSGNVEKYSIPWSFSGVPMRRVGPVAMPAGPRAVAADSGAPDYLRTLRRYTDCSDNVRTAILGYGSLTPVWTLPEGFTQRLGKASTDNFYSGTFAPGARRIGYLRIPHFSPSSTTTALNQLEAEIKFFLANTDGLVVDVMRNNGGSACYCEETLRRLIPTDWKALTFPIRPVWDDIVGFQADLTLAQILGASRETQELLQSMLDNVTEAYNSERGMTGPLSLCANTPNRTPATVVYDKPILVLTDEFSTSAADMFSAMFQDNQRGKLFGWRTNGAGGAVLTEYPGYYIEGGSSRVVVSLMYRAGSIQVKGYPSTHYVENVGVQPDIVWNYMRRDNLLSGGKLFVEAFLTEIEKQIPAAAK